MTVARSSPVACSSTVWKTIAALSAATASAVATPSTTSVGENFARPRTRRIMPTKANSGKAR